METWDLFDERRLSLNKRHQRGQDLNEGEFHIVVEVWTINSRNEVLVTLRDPRKPDYPDKWENTGGSVLSGENSRQGAVRELREETGIIASENELILLGTYKESKAFVDVYLLHRDIPVEHLTMQDGETVAAKWISVEELDSMILNETLAWPTGKRLQHVRSAFDEQLRKR